jgi:hypothetical protein
MVFSELSDFLHAFCRQEQAPEGRKRSDGTAA